MFGVKVGDTIRQAGTNPSALNLQRALNKAKDLNQRSKKFRFAAGVTGGAAGEAFVADVENIGTFGDMFGGGPTKLDREESFGREDASRKLLNRLKFGSEPILITPLYMVQVSQLNYWLVEVKTLLIVILNLQDG